MVKTAHRRGASQRQVAREFGVALSTLQHWLKYADGQRLDRVDWSGRRPGPSKPTNKTSQEMEDLVLTVRRELKETSALGEYGAQAILAELQRRTVDRKSVV